MNKFNINDDVYVQIRHKGWEHLTHTVGNKYIRNCIKPYKTIINSEVWYKLQLWSVFDLFPTAMGKPLLINPVILIADEELTKTLPSDPVIVNLHHADKTMSND